MSTPIGLFSTAKCVIFGLMIAAELVAAPHRVLYVTHSAGFRHDSIPTSVEALRSIGSKSGRFDLTATEDLSQISESNLRNYDAVLFFTSGELALNDAQNRALLDFIRQGKGFAGFHSATDTLYSWSDYGDMIGGYFDGHPWTQEATIRFEDNRPSLRLTEEYYQFRNFSRDKVRVLMSLDITSVDPRAPGAHQDTTDFPLAWMRSYGSGRVYYNALGHFDDTWKNPAIQQLLDSALAWVLGDMPTVSAVGNAATMQPLKSVARGSLISIFGDSLTLNGAIASEPAYATVLAGTTVLMGLTNIAAPLLYASPRQINALVPVETQGLSDIAIRIRRSDGTEVNTTATLVPAAPGIFVVTSVPGAATVWATGLGQSLDGLTVSIAGQPVKVLYAGVSPEFAGLNQVNLELPANLKPGTQRVEITVSGQTASASFELR